MWYKSDGDCEGRKNKFTVDLKMFLLTTGKSNTSFCSFIMSMVRHNGTRHVWSAYFHSKTSISTLELIKLRFKCDTITENNTNTASDENLHISKGIAKHVFVTSSSAAYHYACKSRDNARRTLRCFCRWTIAVCMSMQLYVKSYHKSVNWDHEFCRLIWL